MTAETPQERGYDSALHETIATATQDLVKQLTRIADALEGQKQPTVVKFPDDFAPIDPEAVRVVINRNRRRSA